MPINDVNVDHSNFFANAVDAGTVSGAVLLYSGTAVTSQGLISGTNSYVYGVLN